MPLAFYVDVHVPSAITEGLRRRGVKVLTSQGDGTLRSSDEDLLTRATELERVLFSQDDDLLRIASEWQKHDRHFAGLVFAHQQGASIGQCVEDLELIARCCPPEEMANRVLFLPLR